MLGTSVDVGAFQTSLVVELTAATLDSSPSASTLTLPDAVDLADQFAGTRNTFDPTVFATASTITLQAVLEFKKRALTTTIVGPAAGLTVSGGGKSRVIQLDPGARPR